MAELVILLAVGVPLLVASGVLAALTGRRIKEARRLERAAVARALTAEAERLMAAPLAESRAEFRVRRAMLMGAEAGARIFGTPGANWLNGWDASTATIVVPRYGEPADDASFLRSLGIKP